MSPDTMVTIGELCFMTGIVLFAGVCTFLPERLIIIAMPLAICGFVLIMVGSNVDSGNTTEPKVLESQVQVSDQEYKFCPYCGAKLGD